MQRVTGSWRNPGSFGFSGGPCLYPCSPFFFFEPFSYNLLAPIRPLSRISFLSLPCIRLRRSLRFLFLSLPLAGFAPFIRLVRSLPSVGAEPKSGAVFRRSRTMRRTFCLFSCGRNVNAVAGFEERVKFRRADRHPAAVRGKRTDERTGSHRPNFGAERTGADFTCDAIRTCKKGPALKAGPLKSQIR